MQAVQVHYKDYNALLTATLQSAHTIIGKLATMGLELSQSRFWNMDYQPRQLNFHAMLCRDHSKTSAIGMPKKRKNA